MSDNDKIPYNTVKVILAVLVLTGLVMILNETTLSVALPSLMDDFRITAATAQWLIAGFMLVMGIVLPATGWMLDNFSTRSVFLLAVGSFLVGTVAGAVAPTFEVLLVARAAQAVGTAIIMPLLMTVTMSLVPFEKRGMIMGLIGVVMAAGPATGPTVAGFILSFTTWHGIFWAMVPLVVIAGLFGAFRLPQIGERKKTKLDVLSVLLSVVAFGALIYGISSVGTLFAGGIESYLTLCILLIGIATTYLFASRQVRLGKDGRAFLSLEPLRIKNFTISLSVMVILFGSMLGFFSLLPIYMQGSLLATALLTGMALFPGGILEGVLSPVSGRIFDRFGPRPLIVPGLVISVLSLLTLSLFDENSTVGAIIALHIIFSVGLAMIFTPLMTTALGSLPKSMYSHGSAILGTLEQLGGAAGTAVILSVYSAVSIAAQTAGASEAVAIAQGTRVGFFIATGLAFVALVLAFFIKRVVKEPEDNQ